MTSLFSFTTSLDVALFWSPPTLAGAELLLLEELCWLDGILLVPELPPLDELPEELPFVDEWPLPDGVLLVDELPLTDELVLAEGELVVVGVLVDTEDFWPLLEEEFGVEEALAIGVEVEFGLFICIFFLIREPTKL